MSNDFSYQKSLPVLFSVCKWQKLLAVTYQQRYLIWKNRRKGILIIINDICFLFRLLIILWFELEPNGNVHSVNLHLLINLHPPDTLHKEEMNHM